LEINDGHIEVSKVTSNEVRRAPVDIFFRTLAQSHGPRAVSVVLSGTGADGSIGMKRVNNRRMLEAMACECYGALAVGPHQTTYV
jgi:two-component system CheB/CheR fusion protein